MNKINSEIYVDISVIISMMSMEMKSKISENFINFIENNKSNEYVSNINPKIPLKEQNIRKETKEILGIIYRDFLCSDEERKKILIKEEKELHKLEEEKKKKYNADNIFKENKLKNKHNDVIAKDVSIVEYKSSIIKKIEAKLKMMFHIN